MRATVKCRLRDLPCTRLGPSEEHQLDWFVGPVGRSRDSDAIERSNWNVATKRLSKEDPEMIDHQIHRFGHWACGWIEEIAYRPGSPVARIADGIRKSLDGYPILDEDDCANEEAEESEENDNE